MPTDRVHPDHQLVGLAEAAAFPEFHGRTTAALLNRWCGRGVRGLALRFEFIGGRRHTCRAWCREFLSELNAGRPEKRRHPADQERHRWIKTRLAEARI